MKIIREAKYEEVPTGRSQWVWHCDACNSTATVARGGPGGQTLCAFCDSKAPVEHRTVPITRDEKVSPRVGQCDDCGREVVLEGFTCTCACGADYNSAGQRLAARSQWGEETGETASEILMPYTLDCEVP